MEIIGNCGNCGGFWGAGSGNSRLDFRLGHGSFAELIEGVLLLLEFEEARRSDVGGVEFWHGECGVHVVLF